MWIGVPFCVIAFICCTVALGIPYWATYEDRLFGKLHFGIFQVCSDDGVIGCEYTDDTDTMVGVRVLMSLGTLLLLVALIVAIVKLCSKTDQQRLYIAAGLLAIASGVLIIVGCIIFGTKKELQTRYGENFTFHAGFYLSIIAGVFSLTAGALFLFGHPVMRRLRERQDGRPVDRNWKRVVYNPGPTREMQTVPAQFYSQPSPYYARRYMYEYPVYPFQQDDLDHGYFY